MIMLPDDGTKDACQSGSKTWIERNMSDRFNVMVKVMGLGLGLG
jgi:hypothetical protein